MKRIEISDGNVQLALLMDEVEQGETVVLTRAGLPVGRVIPFDLRIDEPAPPDPSQTLEKLERLGKELAARGVHMTDEEIRAARDDFSP